MRKGSDLSDSNNGCERGYCRKIQAFYGKRQNNAVSGKPHLPRHFKKTAAPKVYETTADKMDFTAIRTDKKWNVLLADDLQLLFL